MASTNKELRTQRGDLFPVCYYSPGLFRFGRKVRGGAC